MRHDTPLSRFNRPSGTLPLVYPLIPGLPSWAIFKTSLRDSQLYGDIVPRIATLGYDQTSLTGLIHFWLVSAQFPGRAVFVLEQVVCGVVVGDAFGLRVPIDARLDGHGDIAEMREDG